MAETSIEWTEHTWNPIAGCSLKSPGCTNCYAMLMAHRHAMMSVALGRVSPYAGLAKVVNGKAVWTGDLRLVEGALTIPLRRRKPTLYFVNSMSDLFHENVPDAWIDRVFAVMALCPQHTFQVLTKRSARMRAYLNLDRRHAVSSAASALADGEPKIFPARAAIRAASVTVGRIADPLKDRWPLPNVWLGVSAEDQCRADERVPDLLATPAAVRFVSAEPLLGQIDFTEIAQSGDEETFDALDSLRDLKTSRGRAPARRLDWIIVGGESGPGARPMHPGWARQIRDACAAAGVAFYFKQWGAWLDEVDATDLRLAPGSEMFDRFGSPKGPKWHPYEASDRHGGFMIRVGKKRAGRLLDGRTWDEMPGGVA